jgi:hypothetical protein
MACLEHGVRETAPLLNHGLRGLCRPFDGGPIVRNPGASIPVRALCAVAALLCGYAAIMIAVTGELRIKGTVTELSPLVRCLPAGVLALMAIVAGWIAATGRR